MKSTLNVGPALHGIPVVGLLTTALVGIFWFAPTELTMGPVQRILYVHVGVAWLGLVGMVLAAAAGLGYLIRRDIRWDHWSQASAELGCLCCTLTLLTGSIWAHEAWGTWWTWDPRLTTALILWMIFVGHLLVRSQIDDPAARARIAAVVVIVGALDVPLVTMATRWFRGIHPVSPEMAPAMKAVLIVSVIAWTVFFALILFTRARQLRLAERLSRLQRTERATTGGSRPKSHVPRRSERLRTGQTPLQPHHAFPRPNRSIDLQTEDHT